MKTTLTPEEELKLLGTPDKALTQDARILKHLIMFPNRGLEFAESWQSMGVYRLSGVIFKLRKAGYNIVTEDAIGHNKYGEPIEWASYRLVRP